MFLRPMVLAADGSEANGSRGYMFCGCMFCGYRFSGYKFAANWSDYPVNKPSSCSLFTFRDSILRSATTSSNKSCSGQPPPRLLFTFQDSSFALSCLTGEFLSSTFTLQSCLSRVDICAGRYLARMQAVRNAVATLEIHLVMQMHCKSVLVEMNESNFCMLII